MTALKPIIEGLPTEYRWRLDATLRKRGNWGDTIFEGTQCCIWTGALDPAGYGLIAVNTGGKQRNATLH
jgi:hypothetical protein